jgi:hypothetical protein
MDAGAGIRGRLTNRKFVSAQLPKLATRKRA